MTMDQAVRTRIETIIGSDGVVLFMKGDRAMPACGFSSRVVSILDGLVDNYATFDVLQDADVRDAIKTYSEWPTLPQLYIKGEFVGGCDIVQQMAESGDLERALGVDLSTLSPPILKIDAGAAAQFNAALAGTEGEHDAIRIEIDAQFRHGLATDAAHPRDIVFECAGLKFAMDRASAIRAGGLSIQFVEGDESGFKIENPNAPPSVKQVSAKEAARALAATPGLEFIDVRSEQERTQAVVEGSTLLNEDTLARLMALPRETALLFICHHGMRSQSTAAQFLAEGFRDVSNITGGIDAWAREVDSTIPRYG